VPALHHEVRISEALAILEYMADLHPDKGFWPDRHRAGEGAGDFG
jgi:glutathione S-transferase